MLDQKLLLREQISIGFIGCGVVGNAISNFYQKTGKYNIKKYDKYKKIGVFNDILDSDLLFLCLPTPFNSETNNSDTTEILNVCEQLNNHKYDGYILVKSTVIPESTKSLNNIFENIKIIHNPEFLSQKTADSDFENQNQIILGGDSKYTSIIKQFYHIDFPSVKISEMSSEESEMVKFALNNFYAVKIQYFTELYLLCKDRNIDYNVVKDSMLLNNWINPMHTQVPGHDGKVSYGGMCFPKDTNAFLTYMKEHSKYYAVLNATIKERDELRND